MGAILEGGELRIGILSDAHGNVIALNECVKSLESRKIGQLLSLGDCVGYFPEANKVLDVLRSAGALCLMGNHEAMLLGLLPIDKEKEKVYHITRSRRAVSQEHFGWISNWLPFREIVVDGLKLLFVHGSPWDPLNGYVYPDFDFRMFRELQFDAVFMGHTHRPFMKRIGKLQLVNVGSCGLPRDARRLLSCAIYDTERKACEMIRVPLDVEELVRRYSKNTSSIVVNRFRETARSNT